MASKPTSSLVTAMCQANGQVARMPRAWLPLFPAVARQTTGRFYSTSTEDAAPPFLQKLKGELKAAMRAKDTARLSVLRSIMSANLNASKTSTPIRTDVQLVALIRKLQKAAQDAVTDAKAAGREDLVGKENEQMAILDEYLAGSGVQSIGEAELKALIQDAVEAAKSSGAAGKSLMGDVMKRLSGALEGKDVDKKSVAGLVKELTGQ